MSKRRKLLLALSVPLLLLTVAFSTRTTAATATTTGTGAPGFTVWPTYGGPGGDTTSPDCSNYSTCWVLLGNPANASASLEWSSFATGEDSSKITFTPSGGVLAPGQHVKVIIKNNPCDGGEWQFTGYALSKNVSGNADAIVGHDCG